MSSFSRLSGKHQFRIPRPQCSNVTDKASSYAVDNQAYDRVEYEVPQRAPRKPHHPDIREEGVAESKEAVENGSLLKGPTERQRWYCIWLCGLSVLFVLLAVAFGVYVGVVGVPTEQRTEETKTNQAALARQLNDTRRQMQQMSRDLNETNPCTSKYCGNGTCKQHGSDVFCVCSEGYTTDNCSIAMRPAVTARSINLNWDGELPEGFVSWRVSYQESSLHQNSAEVQTYENSTTILNLKRLTHYEVKISKLSWTGNFATFSSEVYILQRHQRELQLQWSREADAEKGYFVQARRIDTPKSGAIYMRKNEPHVILDGLDPCTSYDLHVSMVSRGEEVQLRQRVLATTACEEDGWIVGQSVVYGEWSGGASQGLFNQYCTQNDQFPFEIYNQNCNNRRNVGEAISNMAAHSGNQSFHYKRGQPTDGVSDGMPYGPNLRHYAGRSDANFTADADGFYARFWFKPANVSGDGSRFEVTPGDYDGRDRTSTILQLMSSPTGIELATYEAGGRHDTGYDCREFKNCSRTFTRITLISDLDLSLWHKVEMTFRSYPGDYNDVWGWSVNGINVRNTSSYLQDYIHERDNGDYLYISRMRIRSRHSPSDVRYTGFYFDDIFYKVFNWLEPDNTLDEYFTSFEP